MTDEFKYLEHQDYLKAKHGHLVTPDPVIKNIVQEATGDGVQSKKRLILGEQNEVYDVLTTSGQNIIVRISHSQGCNFAQERWAFKNCQKVRVPVPIVLLFNDSPSPDGTPAFCIETKLDGQSLSVYLDSIKDDQEKVRRIIAKSGEMLSKIHSIKPQGFGWLDKNGKGYQEDWTNYMLKKDETKERLIQAAQRTGLNTEMIGTALLLLRKYQFLYQNVTPHLLHGDFGPSHIFVKDEEVVGIIDFENVKSGDPINDLSWWDFFRGNKLPLEWLREGYLDQSIFDKDFELKLHLNKLHLGLGFIDYYEYEKNKTGINITKENLTRDLEYFRTQI